MFSNFKVSFVIFIKKQQVFASFVKFLEEENIMPWYNGDYPPSYKNQPKKIRDKAIEIANEVLKTTGNEGEAIATGLKQARAHFKISEKTKDNDND